MALHQKEVILKENLQRKYLRSRKDGWLFWWRSFLKIVLEARKLILCGTIAEAVLSEWATDYGPNWCI